MFKATKAIYEALKKEDGLKVFTEEHEKYSEVWLQFSVKNGGSYRISFISNDDDNDVKIRVFALTEVPEDKMPQMFKTVNELNEEYRFVKFAVDDDRDVNLYYDFFVDSVSPESAAREAVVRIVQIIDDAYPKIMRTIWA